MPKNINNILKSLKFISLSGIGWIVDLTFFTLLVNQINLGIFLSNCLSSLIAITFVFFISTKSIFDKKKSKIELKYKYLIYIVYQLILVVSISWLAVPINQFICSYFDTFDNVIRYSALITKILITPITMILNFFAMKFLLEKI